MPYHVPLSALLPKFSNCSCYPLPLALRFCLPSLNPARASQFCSCSAACTGMHWRRHHRTVSPRIHSGGTLCLAWATCNSSVSGGRGRRLGCAGAGGQQRLVLPLRLLCSGVNPASLSECQAKMRKGQGMASPALQPWWRGMCDGRHGQRAWEWRLQAIAAQHHIHPLIRRPPVACTGRLSSPGLQARARRSTDGPQQRSGGHTGLSRSGDH